MLRVLGGHKEKTKPQGNTDRAVSNGSDSCGAKYAHMLPAFDSRPTSPESEDFRVLLHLEHFKSCLLQSITERIGVYRHQRVADMDDPHEPALKAVTADKKAAGLQD